MIKLIRFTESTPLCFCLALSGIFLAATQSAIAMQPRYAIWEQPDVTIESVYPKGKRITIRQANGGTQVLSISSRTWFIKDNAEGRFEDLQVGKHLHVWEIPRGGQAVILEVLPTKK